MSTYTVNVPQAGQRISQTQPLIENNFIALDAAIKNDHVAITDATASKRMLHDKVSFPNLQGANPGALGSAGVLYTKDIGGSIAGLFFQNSSVVTQLVGPGNTPVNNNTVANGVGTNYGFKLANGVVINAGTVTPNAKVCTPTFAVPFTSPWAITVSGRYNSGSDNPVTWQNLNVNNVTIYTGNNSLPVFYIAIGI